MPNLSQLLSTKTSAEFQRVFERCRDISLELSDVDGIYVVGGVVRDLILDRVPGDIDLSVVGNAKAFAQALAHELDCDPPTESQFSTYKITVNGPPGSLREIDVVCARSETYTESAALPTIEPSSIEEDLKRRDFSVNAMGISLSQQDWGNLIDPANGFGDIMRKRIKVLHDGSFVDDPTRIFRAVRYATRLDFSIDTRTRELLSHSLSGIDHLSGTRVRHEFVLVLQEPEIVEILRASEELGIIGAISPGLRISTKALQVLESQCGDESRPSNIEDILAYITFGMSEDEAKQVSDRFDGPNGWGESIVGNAMLAKHVALLDSPDLSPSEVVDILQSIPQSSIRAYIAVGSPLPRRGRMVDFLETFQHISPEITGVDLVEAGIPEGPTIGKLLDIVRRARLDGQVGSKQEEIELAKSRVPGFLTN